MEQHAAQRGRGVGGRVRVRGGRRRGRRANISNEIVQLWLITYLFLFFYSRPTNYDFYFCSLLNKDLFYSSK
uniref:Uncharacterized protein n=1 Tax=Anguilla anguilla TaxID=7936 RepID=A0A0E9WK14_ANGAN